jgi:hypothetical protein
MLIPKPLKKWQKTHPKSNVKTFINSTKSGKTPYCLRFLVVIFGVIVLQLYRRFRISVFIALLIFSKPILKNA